MVKIIGELLSLASSTIEFYERGIKTYKKSMLISVIRYIIQVLAFFLLGGINGMLITLMALVRSLFMYRKKFTGKIVCIWITTSVIINVCFMNSFIDLFPLAATLQFTFMAKAQKARELKIAQLVNTAIWIVYHIYHKAYVYILSSILLSVITVIRLKKGVED